MDRNHVVLVVPSGCWVALRKESVDRNGAGSWPRGMNPSSLSARRAWIEMYVGVMGSAITPVALRKESVDRNV